MTIITTSALILDSQGFITAQNVEICDYGDAISIGSALHAKCDLGITGDRITSTVAGWAAAWG
jgi:hypothetical protein